MESKAGSILLLISSIIGFVLSAIMFIISILVIIFPSSDGTSPLTGFIFFFIFFIVILLISLFKLKASFMMKDPKRTQTGGILALVLGVISWDGLSIIGGIVGIVQAGE